MEKYIIINEFNNYAISNFGNVKNEPIDEFNPAKTIMKVLEG